MWAVKAFGCVSQHCWVSVVAAESLSHVWLFFNLEDCSLPGSSPVHGIFQARMLEGVPISSSRGSSWPRDRTRISCTGRKILYHWATREALVSVTGRQMQLRAKTLVNCFPGEWLQFSPSPAHFLVFFSVLTHEVRDNYNLKAGFLGISWPSDVVFTNASTRLLPKELLVLPACQLPGLSMGRGIAPRFSQDHQEIRGGIINELLGTKPGTRWMLGTGIIYQSLGFLSCNTPVHSLPLSLFFKCISSCHSACGTSVLCCFSRVQFFVTPWTVAHQAPLSMGFSRQGYWSGLPCPPPGDLPEPGIEPALAGRFFTIPWPGIKPESTALEAWSFNHRTTRKVPYSPLYFGFDFPCEDWINLKIDKDEF